MIEAFWLDLRFALRGLRLRPAFSAMVVLSLGVGIAANLAIFNLVDGTFLRRLPVRAPGELALFSPGSWKATLLGSPWRAVDGRAVLFSHPLYERLRDGTRGLTVAAQHNQLVPSLLRRQGAAGADAQLAGGRCVSTNFFDILGVEVQRGRGFGAEDDRAQGARPVVVLSDALWRRRFGGDPSAIGSRLGVNGTAYTVIGVMPSGFRGVTVGSPDDFWVPMGMANDLRRDGLDLDNPDFAWLNLFGRLKPGVSLGSAQASADTLLKRYVSEHPEASEAAELPPRIELESGATGMSEARHAFRQALWVLGAGVALLLLLVCLNVSHLLLARAVSRHKEMSVRAALGATQGRLTRQLLTEALLLASLGAAVGLVTAGWLSSGLVRLASSGDRGFHFALSAGFDLRGVAFAGTLAVATGLLLGAVPAWHAAARHGRSSDLQQALRSTSSAVCAAGPRRRVTHALMASQVAFSLVLLVSAGLLGTSLSRLRAVPTGFADAHVLLADLNASKAGLSEDRLRLLSEQLPRQLNSQPGVLAASLSSTAVLGGRELVSTVAFPGSDRPDKATGFELVSPGYFDTLGLRVLRGRGFRRADGPDTQRVAVVNETMATAAFGGKAIGRRIRLDEEHDVEIVGVVSDAHTRDLRRPMESQLYLPLAQPHGLPVSLPPTSLQVRGRGDPAELTAQVRRTLEQIQTGLPLTNVRTLRAQVDRQLVKERLLSLLAGAFGVSALLLVGLGLYGVVSQWAVQRTREMGIRMALGATALDVQWLVMRQALSLLVIGALVGVPSAFAVAQSLRALLFDVDALELRVVLGALGALAAVASLAAYVPARRASGVDPAGAMRSE